MDKKVINKQPIKIEEKKDMFDLQIKKKDKKWRNKNINTF